MVIRFANRGEIDGELMTVTNEQSVSLVAEIDDDDDEGLKSRQKRTNVTV